MTHLCRWWRSGMTHPCRWWRSGMTHLCRWWRCGVTHLCRWWKSGMTHLCRWWRCGMTHLCRWWRSGTCRRPGSSRVCSGPGCAGRRRWLASGPAVSPAAQSGCRPPDDGPSSARSGSSRGRHSDWSSSPDQQRHETVKCMYTQIQFFIVKGSHMDIINLAASF